MSQSQSLELLRIFHWSLHVKKNIDLWGANKVNSLQPDSSISRTLPKTGTYSCPAIVQSFLLTLYKMNLEEGEELIPGTLQDTEATNSPKKKLRKKLFVGILFVDFTKAFDTVSHNILLQKLNALGIRGDNWLWLKKLPYRTKIIRQNQRMRLRYTRYSSWNAARVGPQTHVLSFFTSDLSKSLRSAETYPYADDQQYTVS